MTSKILPHPQINPDIIANVEIEIDAFVGTSRMTVARVAELAEGDIVPLDTLLGDEIELRLNGVSIARGELVTVEDRFAVRITSLAGS